MCTPGRGIDGQQARRLDAQAAADPGAQLRRGGGIAVDLRGIPPVAVQIGVRRRSRGPGRRGIGHRRRHPDPRRAPVVARRRGNVQIASVVGTLVHEPVVDHELNPRRGQQVQDRGGLECVARHQLAADDARVRDHEMGGVREDVLERHVAAEAPAGSPHVRHFQVVERAIVRPRFAQGRIESRRDLLRRERRLFGIVEVVVAELVPDLDELDPAEQPRLLVPGSI